MKNLLFTCYQNGIQAVRISLLTLATVGLAGYTANTATATDNNSEQSRLSKSIGTYSTEQTGLRQKIGDAAVLQLNRLEQTGTDQLLATNQLATNSNQDYQQAPSYVSDNFSIFDAYIDLYGDYDGDGFYYQFSIFFDIDTSYDYADVYAKLFLSYEGGPWNFFYLTDIINLRGDGSHDAYEVANELGYGYPTGYYDLLIEIYDNESDDLVVVYGPNEDIHLSDIPLEDEDSEIIISYSDGADYHSGGGAMDYLSILLLLLGFIAFQIMETRLSPKKINPQRAAPSSVRLSTATQDCQ